MVSLSDPALNYKEQIKTNFSAAAFSYDQHAIMQKFAAESLASIFPKCEKGLEILEVGCGTGLVSQHIVNKYPDSKIILSDISLSLLEQCSKKIKGPSFKVLDAEEIKDKNKYDLIISGLTSQWFINLEATLVKLYQALKPDGQIIFSTLGSNTFENWQAICQKFQLPYTGNNFISEEDLISIISNLTDLFSISTTTYCESYTCLKDFFKSLKNIGATTNQNNSHLSVPQYRRLESLWMKNNSLEVSYEIILFSIKSKIT